MFKDLSGQRFGRWLVLEQAESEIRSDNRRIRKWLCVCDCGTTRAVREQSLKSGRSKSCGCYHSDIMPAVGRDANTTHGMSDSRIYRIYKHMRNRCENQNDISYCNYGARGISVCDEWKTFEPFYKWAMQSGYKDSLSIDRIDVNSGYSPENCRWSDATEQAINRRSTRLYQYNGESHCISEWASLYNMNYKKLWKRLHNGWDIQTALTT